MLDVCANSLECLLRLRMMGCNLSIDDFGAGFSSLQRLCDLPFNEIKLDAQFAYAVTQDLRSRVVISTIQRLGTSLGMAVVIEGIETLEQCQLLQSLGCVIGQGYVFSRAMSESQLIRWLDETVSTDG
jgi:EAL domain-containing protein (putative c-di-GMP-specific phosphodiesterase class I)